MLDILSCVFLQMGNESSTLSKDSPLQCIIKNWYNFDPQTLKKKCPIYFCIQAWPQYQLVNGKSWPLEGSLNYNIILQLDLSIERMGSGQKSTMSRLSLPSGSNKIYVGAIKYTLHSWQQKPRILGGRGRGGGGEGEKAEARYPPRAGLTLTHSRDIYPLIRQADGGHCILLPCTPRSLTSDGTLTATSIDFPVQQEVVRKIEAPCPQQQLGIPNQRGD